MHWSFTPIKIATVKSQVMTSVARMWRYWTLMHCGWGRECGKSLEGLKCQAQSYHLAQQFHSFQEKRKHLPTKSLHTNVTAVLPIIGQWEQ